MIEWYYRVGDDVQGPVSEEDLHHIFKSGALPGQTLVWCEGMGDWRIAQEISGLSISPPNLADSTTSIQFSKKQVVVGVILFLVVAIFCLAHTFQPQKSPAAMMSSGEISQDDFVSVDPRTISNPYMITDDYGPVVSGQLSSITKGELDLFESRGLSGQQSIYTILLIHKFGYDVSNVLAEWDNLEMERGEWDGRNINLWDGSLLNAYLEGKKMRDANK